MSAGRRRAADVALLIGGALVAALAGRSVVHRPAATLYALLLVLALVLFVGSAAALRHLRPGRLLTGLLLLIPIAALLGPSLALPALPSLFAFRVALALLLYLGLVWLAATRPPLHLGAATPYVLGLVLWIGWLVLAMAWAPDKATGFRYLGVVFTMLVLLFATAAAGTSRARLKALLYTLAVAYGLIVMMAMVETVTGYRLPVSRLIDSTSPSTLYAVTSFFHNQNDLATYLAICWPFFLCALFFTRRAWWIVLAVAAMALGAATFVHTGSRSSMLAVGIESLVCLVFFARGLSLRNQVIGALAALALIGGAGWLAFNDSSSDMLRQFRLQGLETNVKTNQGSGEIRSNLTQRGLSAIGAYYLLGAGPGQAEPLMSDSIAPVGIPNLHNWWLEVAVNGGLPGFIFFAVVYFGLLVALIHLARHCDDEFIRYLASATALALIGFIIGALGPSSSVSFTPLWIMLGLGVAIVLLNARETEAGATGAAGGAPS